MEVESPPLDGWKAVPCQASGFDWRLERYQAAPFQSGLSTGDLETLLAAYDRVEVRPSDGQLEVLVR